MAETDVTNSERRKAACAHRWLYRYGLGLSAEPPTLGMRTGSIIHLGLEQLGPQPQADLLASPEELAIDAMRAKADEIISSGQPEGSVIDPSRPVVDVEAVNEALRLSVALVRRYIERYGLDAGFPGMLFTERTIRANARVPETGRKSPVTFLAGVLDGVAEINGQLWLVERKTTVMNLEDWYRTHRYDPQATTYGWLAREGLEMELAGVLYDIILRDVPLRAEELSVTRGEVALDADDIPTTSPTKSEPRGRLRKPAPGSLPKTTAPNFLAAVASLGHTLDSVDWYREVHDGLRERDASTYWTGRLHSPGKDQLPRTTGPEFLKAVQMLGQTLDSVEWYRSVHSQLVERDDAGYWFRREAEPFYPGQIDRAGIELYHAATKIRRWRELTQPYREAILAEASENGGRAGAAAAEAVRVLGPQFERNPAMCREYNRLCEFAHSCELGTYGSVRELLVRDSIHPELADEADTGHDSSPAQ